jgi:hypothetical protein
MPSGAGAFVVRCCGLENPRSERFMEELLPNRGSVLNTVNAVAYDVRHYHQPSPV